MQDRDAELPVGEMVHGSSGEKACWYLPIAHSFFQCGGALRTPRQEDTYTVIQVLRGRPVGAIML